MQDNGRGIPSELRERIFESFFRARDPTAPVPLGYGDGEGYGPVPVAAVAGAGAGGTAAAAAAAARAASPTKSGTGAAVRGANGGGAAAAGGSGEEERERPSLPGGLSGNAKGHGLGLAITKQLVDLLGGRIAVQSSVSMFDMKCHHCILRLFDSSE